MTLPAHRFEHRKKDDGNGAKVFVVDFDETITTCPELIAHVATALRANGDKVYVLTGNDSPRDELLQRLKDYGMPFDDLIQYHDSQSDGIARAHYLKQLDAFCGIDNRIDRAGTYVQAAPHLFLVAEPPKVAKEDAQGSKKKAKKAVKALRHELRGPPRIPPNYSNERGTPETHCGNCDMFWQGACWSFGGVRVDAERGKCDEWMPELPPDESTP